MGFVVLLGLALASCGGDEPETTAAWSTTTSIGGSVAEPTCQDVLRDPFFEGDGSAGLAVRSGRTIGCTLDFRAGDAALTKLGMQSECPPGASIVVAVDVDPEAMRWVFDPRKTAALDNGECFDAMSR